MSDFEVQIAGAGGVYRVSARSPAGETRPEAVRFPFDDDELRRRLQDVELALTRSAARVRRLTPVDERPVQDFGGSLFEFAFPSEMRAHLRVSRQQADAHERPFRIRLRIEPPELSALPWEFMYDPAEEEYLCLGTPVVRYLDLTRPRPPLAVVPPLRVLVMASAPDGLVALDVAEERARLTEAFHPVEATGRVRVDWVEGQTWWDLQNALELGNWNVLHFIGHGALDPTTGEGLIALAEEDGSVHRFGADNFARLLADKRSLRLVVLNSCETARSTTRDRFSSTAATLMRRGVPAVVAMQYEITDPAAVVFTRGFYTALGHRYPVDRAVTRARQAIRNSGRSTLEWATPVLHLRSGSGDLFDLTGVPEPVPAVALAGPDVPDDPYASPAYLAQAYGESTTGQVVAPAYTPYLGPAYPPYPGAVYPPWAPTDAPGELFLLEHARSVETVAFCPDGALLASGDWRPEARIWDTFTGDLRRRIPHRGVVLGHVADLAFAPDARRLATASMSGMGGRIRILDARTGRELVVFGRETRARRLAWSPDGTRLASASSDRLVRVWDPDTGLELLSAPHGGPVVSVSFSPDGTLLASAAATATAGAYAVLDAGSGDLVRTLQYDGAPTAVGFGPDGTRLLTASYDGTARIWDLNGGHELARFTHDGVVSSAVWSPDGTRVATASHDLTTRVWETASGAELARITSGSRVNAVAFSPDGTRLATAGPDYTARVWALNLE